MRFFRTFTTVILRNPRKVLFSIGVLTVIAFYYLVQIRIDFTIEKLFPRNDPEVDYYLSFREDFEREDRVIFVAVSSDSLFTNKNLEMLEELSHRLGSIEGIEEIISIGSIEVISGDSEGVKIFSPFEEWKTGKLDLHGLRNLLLSDSIYIDNIISRDAGKTGIYLKIGSDYNYDKARAEILRKIRNILREYPGEFYLAGFPVIRTDYVRFIWNDWARFIPLIILIMAAIAYLHFRNLYSILAPLVTVLIATIWTMGFMSFLGITVNIISYLVPALIVVVGISDSIHIFNRYREELYKGNKGESALTAVMGEIGTAIFLTSFTTAVGFSSLSFTNIELIREFGLMVAFGVMCAFILSITIIPITLTRRNNPAAFLRDSNFRKKHQKILEGTDRIIQRRRNLIICSVLGITLIAVFFAGKINPDIHFMDDIHHSNPLYKSHQFINRYLGGVFPLEIVLDSGRENGIYSPELMKFADKVEYYLRNVPEIGKVISVADYIKQINRYFQGGKSEEFKVPESDDLIAQYIFLYELDAGDDFEGMLDFNRRKLRIAARMDDCGSQRMEEIVRELRGFLEKESPDRVQCHVTGTTMLAMKTNLKMVNNLVNSFFIAFVVIAFTIIVLFRSVRLSVISIIPNLIPLIGLAGFMGITGIHLRPSTAVTFAIAFGIAIDDTIHFISRFRVESLRNGEMEKAVHRTILKTGYAIIATSEILVIGLSVLMISTFVASENFALLMAVTLSGALLGDLFLLPALILRFGKINSEKG